MKKTGSRNRDAVEVATPWWNRLRQTLVAAAVALVVVSTLIVSESAVPDGTHVVPMMAWLLLATVVLVCCLAGPRWPWRVGWTEAGVVLFLLAHSLSALVMLRAGHARLTLNALWLWIALGIVFLAVRQLFTSGLEQRALVSVMIALATGLSAFGLYQVGYSNPALRAQYAEDPDAALREAGIEAPPGSPQRQHYENRLASREPIGPFALTNSLAGLLTPSLVLLLFLVGSCRGKSPRGWPYALGMALPALIVAGCLLLTKSRSAYGALLVATLLLLVARAVPRRSFHWPILAGACGILIIVAAATGRLAGLDRQVITEAPKSLAFRLQYWRATGTMIADYPWFGCGPGNFQSFYTRYKEPEASEEIADPHSFLLEIAATAGLPALALFLLIPGAVLWDVAGRRRPGVFQFQPPVANSLSPVASRLSPIYAGLVAGFVLAYPAGWAGGLPPDLAVLSLACPVSIGTLWLLHTWVIGGRLPRAPVLIAVGALLVHLLVAGGIGFPGVGQWVWLLAAVALNAGDSPSAAPRPAGRRHVVGMSVALVACVLLVGGCLLTMYRPVLAARQAVELAREATTEVAAERALDEAAAADPWWGEPWEFRTELESRQWLASFSDRHLAAFFAARDALLARERNSSRVYRRCGDWLLEMFAASGRVDVGAQAVAAYTQAVELYPASGILRAQLAWACHVTGDEQQARHHADEALRLDALMPHVEYKLAHQRLVGDYLTELSAPAGADRSPETAEQLMQRVRKVKNR